MPDRVVVLYRGRIVEQGATETVFARPRHRYTTMLLSAIPVISQEDEAFKPDWPWQDSALDEGGDTHSRLPVRGTLPVRARELREHASGNARRFPPGVRVPSPRGLAVEIKTLSMLGMRTED